MLRVLSHTHMAAVHIAWRGRDLTGAHDFYMCGVHATQRTVLCHGVGRVAPSSGRVASSGGWLSECRGWLTEELTSVRACGGRSSLSADALLSEEEPFSLRSSDLRGEESTVDW